MSPEMKELRCPSCRRGGTISMRILPGDQASRGLSCANCGHQIPAIEGVPNFAEHLLWRDPGLGRAQKAMNSRFFARLYETPFWRPFHTRIGSGISLKREIELVLDMAGTGRPEAVADLACGTGFYARALARQFPSACHYGLDLSISMLKEGQRLARRGGSGSIFFLRGDLNRLPFEDTSLDRVNCGGALHLFSHLFPIWREITRVLKPGGVFTAMTLTLGKGPVRRLQGRIMRKGLGTFFEPEALSKDLDAVGLSLFRCQKHRLSFLFAAVKK